MYKLKRVQETIAHHRLSIVACAQHAVLLFEVGALDIKVFNFSIYCHYSHSGTGERKEVTSELTRRAVQRHGLGYVQSFIGFTSESTCIVWTKSRVRRGEAATVHASSNNQPVHRSQSAKAHPARHVAAAPDSPKPTVIMYKKWDISQPSTPLSIAKVHIDIHISL
jgi:hypothetical protein